MTSPTSLLQLHSSVHVWATFFAVSISFGLLRWEGDKDRLEQCSDYLTSEEVSVSVSGDKRTECHVREETGEIHDFCVWIATVEFCALRYSCPESVFEAVFWWLRVLQILLWGIGEWRYGWLLGIRVMEDVEKFKGFLYHCKKRF